MMNITNIVNKRKIKSSTEVAKSKKMCENNEKECDDSLTLLNLNDDCLFHIFGYLKMTDVLNVSDSCEQLRQVIDDFYTQVKHFAWKSYRPVALATRIFSKIGQYLVELIIYGNSLDQTLFIDIIRSNCPNLKCLKFTNCVINRMWLKCLNSLHSLESLTFFSSSFPYDNLMGVSTLKEFKLQHCFELHRNLLNSVTQYNVDIEQLTLEYNRPLPSVLNNFNLAPISKMSSLKSLCLYIHPNTVQQLEVVLQLTKLKKLKITSRDTHLNINEFLKQMSETGALEELEIIEMFVNDETFTALNMMKLKTLKINRPKISDPQLDIKGICQILSNTKPDLRHLTLSLYDLEVGAAVDGILILVTRLKHLEELNVFHWEYPDGNFDYGCNVPIVVKKITNVLQVKCRPELKLLLPWAISAKLFDSNGQIHEQYHSTDSKLVQFPKSSFINNCDLNSVTCMKSSFFSTSSLSGPSSSLSGPSSSGPSSSGTSNDVGCI